MFGMAKEVKRKIPQKIIDGKIDDNEVKSGKEVKVNNNLYKINTTTVLMFMLLLHVLNYLLW